MANEAGSEPTEQGAQPSAVAPPWRRVRFWVAGVLILLFVPQLPTQPAGALIWMAIIAALYWKWDSVTAWNRRRMAGGGGAGMAGGGSGGTAGLGAGAPASVSSSSYVGQTLTAGESVRYRAHLSGWIFIFGLVIFAIIPYFTTEMVVTNRRVIVKHGWIARRTVELRLSKVESAQVRQGVFGRLLGFGSVQIIGTGGTRETFGYVADPLAFRRAISEALDLHEGVR